MGDLSSKVGDYGHFIYLRSYSRWLDDKKRREEWDDTVDRYIDFMKENLEDRLDASEYKDIGDAIRDLNALPSMRLLWSAGEAARLNPAAGFNCSFVGLNDLHAFSEMLFLLCSGTGVGFSCEREQVNKLPEVSLYNGKIKNHFVIPDSREGWADALLYGMRMWYSGQDAVFDYSRIRPAGSPLKTFGGRSSGPDPIRELLEFTKKTILDAQGRKLTPLECHDIACMIAKIVVSGGTRRSSLISLSDLDEKELRYAKFGYFPEHRYLSNNSAVYESKPDIGVFQDEWSVLVESGTGERGIFNRGGLRNSLPERRKPFASNNNVLIGGNPCLEVVLLVPGGVGGQMCNLTNIVVGERDGISELMEKARMAAILGTYQSMLTDFSYLRPEWKRTCESERLLGVSLSGVFDNALLMDSHVLQILRDHVVRTNREYAKRFGINPSTATTCIKPNGTAGQMTGSGSGAHPRYSRHYIRRVRISASDPLFKLVRERGIPYHPENGQDRETANTFVLEFPVKSSDSAVLRDDITALEHLECWKNLRINYTEHLVSATIYVAEDEWDSVGKWVWDNWDHIGGLSFLPKEDENIKYDLAPYEEIDEAEYKRRESEFKLDFSRLSEYENGDRTTGAKEYACVGDKCELS